MSYNESKYLVFAAYKKPEFKTKYLNMKSCHLQSYKKAIVRGVSICLAGLTTRTPTNQDQVYPHSTPKFTPL